MEEVELRCLGGVELRRDGHAIEIGPRKVRALLAYLAAQAGTPLSRERLAALLWSRSAQRQAMNSLNQAVYTLRRALDAAGAGRLTSESDSVALGLDGLSFDVARFEALAADADPASRRAAFDLYRGSFLDGLEIDEPEFAAWVAAERARLDDRAVALGHACLAEAAPGNAEETEAVAQRLLAIDPYDEEAVLALIAASARRGRTARAVGLYETYRERLAEDLGIEVPERVRQAAEAVRAGDVKGPSLSPPGEAAAPVPLRGRVALVGVATMIAVVVALIFFLQAPPADDPGPPVLLVLPLEAAGSAGALAERASGLVDDLSAALVRLDGLRVLARDTAASRETWTAEQARALGATHLLRTRLSPSPDGPVLDVRMIDTGSAEEVWAKRQRVTAEGLMALRGQLLATLVPALTAEIGSDASTRAAAPPTQDTAAYDRYLAGLAALSHGGAAENAGAIALLREAGALDPAFEDARAALARALYRVAFGSQSFAEAAGRNWLEAYVQMKRLLPALREAAHPAALGIEARLALRRHDLDAAATLARAAIEQAPNDETAWLALAEALALAGDAGASLAAARRALQLNPARPGRAFHAMGLARFAAGDLVEAEAALEQALAASAEPEPETLGLLAAAAFLRGDAPAAEARMAVFLASVESRPKRLWRVSLPAEGNPRSLTWNRPTLAGALTLYPFREAVTLERVARGLEGAGIPGATLGAYELTAAHALSGAEIETLLFGAEIAGWSLTGGTGPWRQTRSGDGVFFQETEAGPAPLSREGRSAVLRNTLCDRWTTRDGDIESCARLFRAGGSGVLPGSHVMVTETGVFPFEIARN